MIRKRLHRQIYVTIVASIFLVGAATGAFFAVVDRQPRDNPFEIIAQLISVAVPDDSQPPQAQQRLLDRMAAKTTVDLAIFGADRSLIAQAGRFSASPDFDELEFDDPREWEYDHRSRSFIMQLPDGRYFAASSPGIRAKPPLLGLLAYIALIAVVIGLGAYPFVRKLTGRLQRLQTGVERIGEGDLSTRVNVEGKDEVATLASSFNTAAERIERLVNSNRQLLAHASHELRTPLARVRLGVEMLKTKEDPKRRAALEADIAELDGLIDEILTMSRLDTGATPSMEEEIDLLALAAEECARYDACDLDGTPATVRGNTRLLRRLLRNLLDNAHKHGKPPVSIRVARHGGHIILAIEDGGNGIAPDLRETVFQPFVRGSGKQNVDGYGLGLALVAQIARAHGGSVSISDAASSRIEVTLPALTA